jgi:hypothetical protein
MQTYLRHPVHGTKIATFEMEVEHDKELGWTEYDPEAFIEPEVSANTLEVKRRGRPPLNARA